MSDAASIPVATAAATKNDQGKPDLSLIPRSASVEMAKAFMVGQEKYGRWNYLKGGMTTSRLTAAAKRHIDAYLDGEEEDRSDPLAIKYDAHHLGAALASIAMLVECRAKGRLVDERFACHEEPRVVPPSAVSRFKVGQVWEDRLGQQHKINWVGSSDLTLDGGRHRYIDGRYWSQEDNQEDLVLLVEDAP